MSYSSASQDTVVAPSHTSTLDLSSTDSVVENVLDDIMRDGDLHLIELEEETESSTAEPTAEQSQQDPPRSEAVSTSDDRHRPSDRVFSSRGKLRCFLLKTFTRKHLLTSIEKCCWATQRHNESKLEQAFREGEVILIFSVNNSGCFQGYARMLSPIGSADSTLWQNDSFRESGVFRVEWLQALELPFTATTHLRNPLNYGKPVKIGRDGQEIPVDIAHQLCALIDDYGVDSSLSSPSRLSSAGQGGVNMPSTPSAPVLRRSEERNWNYSRSRHSLSAHPYPYPLASNRSQFRPQNPSQLSCYSSSGRVPRHRQNAPRHWPASSLRRERSGMKRRKVTHDWSLLNMTYDDYLRNHSMHGYYPYG